ncbi:MAG: hypothetical protein V4739_08150 [Pseudomonadota bacterium]
MSTNVDAGSGGWGAQHADGSQQWLQMSEAEQGLAAANGGPRMGLGMHHLRPAPREMTQDRVLHYTRASTLASLGAVGPETASPPEPAALAPATPSAQEQAEVAQMRAVWAGSAHSDPYRVFQQMHEFGWSAARLAQAVGTSEEDVANLLIRLGAPEGFASPLTVSREQINADYLAQLQQAQISGQWTRVVPLTTYDESGLAFSYDESGLALDESGQVITRAEFDVKGFTQHYLAQQTPQARRFAAVHGALLESPPTEVRFASGLAWSAGAASWAANDRVAHFLRQPPASSEELVATVQEVLKPLNQEILTVFGGQAALPNNDLGETMRARYGTELGTTLYRLDHAIHHARAVYADQLNRAIRGESALGWHDGPPVLGEDGQPMVGEDGHAIVPRVFDPLAFHRAVMSQGDAQSQLLARLYGQAHLSSNGELVLQGEGGTLQFSFASDESGAIVSATAANALPPGLVKVELAAPPDMFDSTQVSFMVGMGFVTAAQNIKPKKKKKSWFKKVLTIAAVVAVGVFTAGTAAPALLGALGMATGAATTLAGAMITGAMVGAATTMTSGLIMTGKIDLKSIAKGALVGGITGGVMNQVQGTALFKNAAMFGDATKAVQVGTRMVVQGSLQEATGGDFKTGALAALGQGLGEGAQGLTQSALGEGVSKAIGKVVQASVSGGGNADAVLEAVASSYVSDVVGDTVRGWLPPSAAQGAAAGTVGNATSKSKSTSSADDINGSDFESDRQASLHGRDGSGPPSHPQPGEGTVKPPPPAPYVVGNGDRLETVAKQLYGDQWRAGLSLMVMENDIRLNKLGSPMLLPGQVLKVPELSELSREELLVESRRGGDVVARNSVGIERAKEDEARRVAHEAAQQAQKEAQNSVLSLGGGPLSQAGVDALKLNGVNGSDLVNDQLYQARELKRNEGTYVLFQPNGGPTQVITPDAKIISIEAFGRLQQSLPPGMTWEGQAGGVIKAVAPEFDDPQVRKPAVRQPLASDDLPRTVVNGISVPYVRVPASAVTPWSRPIAFATDDPGAKALVVKEAYETARDLEIASLGLGVIGKLPGALRAAGQLAAEAMGSGGAATYRAGSSALSMAGDTRLAVSGAADIGTVGNAGAGSASFGRSISSHTAVSPGPLEPGIAGTFAGGRYSVFQLADDTLLYRAGTADKPFGQFFDTVPPQGVLQTRIDKAVLPVWPGGGTSPLDTAFAVKVPKGTTVYVGETGSQGGFYVGGTQQVVVPKPWTIDGVQVISSTPLP